ncbi:MAG: hypothetical protein RM049_23390 [Nostoc sp. DedQUE04]|uniref:hypothetical protein n=1 Tax=Nostoc sp. DedQUE04 TaxID=3075390 RepID=UPI002AD31DE5|nr:hypothetical protein [Nostoc sp. DedQUE04]MDZ8138214.1 hypothetical protein [Nostoc sp. DedQUE04]
MLDYQDFKDSVSELQSFYGGNILNGGILEAAWYETLKHLSLGRLHSGIARCFKKHPRAYNFFPSVDQILEFAQGEYRPPGERVMGNFSLPVLPSHEDRLTPEQIAELSKRGQMVARIILNCTGYMTSERKEELIERFKTMPTHELENIAFVSQRTRKSGISINNIADILEKMEQNFEAESTDEYYKNSKAIARQWLEEQA